MNFEDLYGIITPVCKHSDRLRILDRERMWAVIYMTDRKVKYDDKKTTIDSVLNFKRYKIVNI